MPYRAPAGGGLFGSSVYPDSRPRIDIGSAIDAIGGTALSLTQQAYNRRLGQQQLALEQQRQADARQQMANEERYRGDQLALERSNAQFEQGIKTRQQDAADTSAIADYYSRGFVDEPPPATTGATTGATTAAAPVDLTAAPPGPSAGPRMVRRGDGMVGAPTAAAAPAPASSSSSGAAAPAITVGGRRLVYKGYGASTAGQAEQARESFEKSQKETDEAFAREMEKAKAGDERALENLKYMHDQNLIPIKAKAEADAFFQKQEFGNPTQDETTAATQLPEMIKAHQIMEQMGKPDIVADLTKKYGTLGKALQSSEGQRFLQASKQFSITGTLATEGARYSPEKQKASDEMFIPSSQTKDAATLAQISNSRRQRILDAAAKSGRAWNRLPLETQQYLVDSLGYKPVRGQLYQPQDGSASSGSTAAPTGATPPATGSGRRVGGRGAAGPATDYVSKYGITPGTP